MVRISRIIFNTVFKRRPTSFTRNSLTGSDNGYAFLSYGTERKGITFVEKIQEEKSVAVKEGRFGGFIPIDQLQVTYSEGSNRTGTNNLLQVKSQVQIKFKVQDAKWLPKNLCQHLMKQIDPVDSNGFMSVTSNKCRNQMLNQADCLQQIRQKLFSQYDKMQSSKEVKEKKPELNEKGGKIRQTYKGIELYRHVPVDLETKEYSRKFKYSDRDKNILDSRLLEEQRYYLSKHKVHMLKQREKI